jgi:hypothetical protein
MPRSRNFLRVSLTVFHGLFWARSASLRLDKSHLDDALGEFFGNYELLNQVYQKGLINDDMSYDAFASDLEKALRDTKARVYLSESLQEDADFYSGVFELAKNWEIQFPPIVVATGSANSAHKGALGEFLGNFIL